MFEVYLAGPITGLNYEGCTDWRKEFPEIYFDLLNKTHSPQERYDVHFLSPMRGKEYLKKVGEINGSYNTFDALATSRGIMSRDRNDCNRAKVIVFNLLGSKIVSIGTVMELAWAWDHRIPTVVIMEDGNIHTHPFIKEATDFKVETLEDAAYTLFQIIG